MGITLLYFGSPFLPKYGKVRLCIALKVTVNKFVSADQYPLPKPEDLFQKFYNCKIDLSSAHL